MAVKEATMDKAKMYAEQLVAKIENGEIKRKCLPEGNMTISFAHSAAMQELMLYHQKKYLGSLRYWLDKRTMTDFPHVYVG